MNVKLLAIMTALGLSHPSMRTPVVSPDTRLRYQAFDVDKEAIQKAATKRERRNKKRVRDSYTARFNNPIIRRGMTVFIDAKKFLAECPKSDDLMTCPECGDDMTSDYGFASGYGLGAYNYCDEHGVFDFSEDPGV